MEAFRRALDRIPEGYSEGEYDGRRYRVEKTLFADGRSVKLVAAELGGPDYISLNLYRPERGGLLKPCEMPEAKVRAFVTGLTPDAAFTKYRAGDTFGTTREG